MIKNNPISIQIGKDKTQIIKGIAILLMVAHHCLIGEFYLKPDPFLSTLFGHKLVSLTKMCVGLFTFFVGYGYFFSSQNKVSYTIQHITKLLKNYWIVLFLIAIPLSVINKVVNGGGYHIDVQNVILNAFGLKHGLCLGNWYIYFYFYALLIMPLIKCVMKKNEIVVTFGIIVGCAVLNGFCGNSGVLMEVVSNCLFYTPVLAVGYLCAKAQILTIIGNYIPGKLVWFIICIVTLACRAYAGGSLFHVNLDTFAAPVVVASICALFAGHEGGYVAKALSKLGSLSVMIWFVHCIFFSDATRRMFQESNLWSDNLFLVYFGVLAVSIIVSIPLLTLVSKIRINKI